MILFISDGRLGNQLFQYSFLKTIAENNEKIVCFNMNQLFSAFDITDNKILIFDVGRIFSIFVRKFLKPFVCSILCRIRLVGYISQNKNELIRYSSYKEVRGLLNLRVVETNFYQSETFFDINKIDLHIKKSDKLVAKKILNSIPDNFIPVFIHVRRTDYLEENFNGIKGIDLPEKYYRQGMVILENEVINPYYIILSDDFKYASLTFSDIDNKYISKNPMMIDFALMTMCKYGIVSNSSFSWWGAYLMEERRSVIFPKYWYGWKVKVESHENIQPEWGTIIEVI